MIAQILNPEQIIKIHNASLRVLENTGVQVPHPEMLSRFADHGAKVDLAQQRVRIPAELVLKCIAQAGKQFTLYGRDRSQNAVFGAGKRNYNSTAGQALWIDKPGQQRRYPTLADVTTAARFGDALEQINVVGPMADPHELPVNHRCVAVAAELIRNTTKPLKFWFHDRASARYIIEILIALCGSAEEAAKYPLCYPFLEPISPLRFPFNGIDLLLETSRLNLPVPIGPMAQMGLSAPGTIAGTLTQQNAEVLAGVCITQLIRPGMPVCYGGVCHAFDMGTTQTIFSGPEQAIFGVAMTQIGKHYGLPVYINVGLTDSKLPDAQAGLESGMTLLAGAAAGADIFGHMGICGADQGASLDILMLQNEIISFAESVLRPINLSDEAIGLAEIEDAGPGGTFIDREHTVEHFRKELWFPQLLDRQFFQAWRESGAADMATRCAQRKDDIQKNHTATPVSADLDRALTQIVKTAQRELGNS